MPKKIIHGIIIGAVSAIIALTLSANDLLNWIERPLWDRRVKTFAKQGQATNQIRLIFLDQTSLNWGKEEIRSWSWPWSRQIYAAIIDFCKRGGAKAVVFDVLFTEPSERIEDDEALVSAIKECPGFVSTIFLSNEQGANTNWPANIPNINLKIKGLKKYISTHNLNITMDRCEFPITEIATNSIFIGNVYTTTDPDSTIRRTSLFHIFDNQPVPALGLAAFLAANPETPVSIQDDSLHIGTRTIPLDSKGRTILNFRGPSQTHKTVNATAVIQSELRILEGKQPVLDPSFFKNCYVFFGFTAPALLDLKSTPIGTIYPGVEVHATILDNIISNDFIWDAPYKLEILFTILFALLAGILGRSSIDAKQVVISFSALLPLPVIFGFAAYKVNCWLNISVQEVAVIFSLVVSVIVNYAIEGRQKLFIKSAFKQYLSPVVIEQLIKTPEQLSLGGETRELSIFFSDIQGFTSISEKLSPEELTALLNDYLTAMTNIILKEGGTVDKYEGDAIIAFWNAPLDLKNHAIHAISAALQCQEKLKQLRPSFNERVGSDIFARIGVNTGEVVVGNMGSHQRFDYTFLGDAGNLASRLEGINKQFGTYIMISEYTFNLVSKHFAGREISRVKVVGRNKPIRVFEPLTKEDFILKKDIINTFASALEKYYNGNFKEALQLFSNISGQDQPSLAYTQRCKELIKKPPSSWDGVWVMHEK